MGGCMRKTKRNINENISERSIESLPIECLLLIFKWLQFDDLMSAARTCRLFEAAAKVIFSQNISVTINRPMVEKGDEHIDRFFYYMREYVQCLDIDCSFGKLNWNKIINGCTNLQTLKISNWIGEALGNVSPSLQIDNVEHLALYCCDSDFMTFVFERVHKLNGLEVIGCSINPESDAFAQFLQKNPNIKSFHFCSKSDEVFYFDFRIVTLLSNLEEFNLVGGKFENISELLQLNRLLKLDINCKGINLNDVLYQLGKKGILQELKLFSVEVDDVFFQTMKSFDKLQVLILSPSTNLTIISPVWPVNLKQLQLFEWGQDTYFTLSFKAFMSTIEQLHYLEIFNLMACEIVDNEKVHFKDFEKLSQRILNVMNHEVRKKRLYVYLPGHLGKGIPTVILNYIAAMKGWLD